MIGAGASGSANYAKSNINSTYASVTAQSGLKAGDGGFTVNVQGNTELKGGAMVILPFSKGRKIRNVCSDGP